MFQPSRILAVLIIAGAASAAQARATAPMPELMLVDLSAPMPAHALRSVPIFRSVTSLGTTKPAGTALDARGGTKSSLDAESRRLDRLIRTAVCTGC